MRSLTSLYALPCITLLLAACGGGSNHSPGLGGTATDTATGTGTGSSSGTATTTDGGGTTPFPSTGVPADITGNAPVANDPTPASDTELEKRLRAAVRFYGAQRCGDGNNWLLAQVPAGSTCHTDDGSTVSADLTGGWHDAGDHIKVSLTVAYAAYGILKAYDAFPAAFDDLYNEGYGDPNQIPDVLDEAKYALDYLAKVLLDDGRLAVLVGDGDKDHGTWLTSAYESAHSMDVVGVKRPVKFQAAKDVAGLSAAALALGSRLYRAHGATEAADLYLTKAKALYAFAKTAGESNQGPWYPNGTTNDDLFNGAAELYAATDDATYLSDIATYDTERSTNALCWANDEALGRHTLAKKGATVNKAAWTSSVDGYVSGGIPGNFDSWGKLRYGCGAGFSAALYADAYGGDGYETYAVNQLNNVTGLAAPGTKSAIIGFGPTPPTQVHHRNAHSPDTPSAFDPGGWVPVDANAAPLRELTGALLGDHQGANPSIEDYQVVEVAIDYNVGLVGVAAFAVAKERGN